MESIYELSIIWSFGHNIFYGTVKNVRKHMFVFPIETPTSNFTAAMWRNVWSFWFVDVSDRPETRDIISLCDWLHVNMINNNKYFIKKKEQIKM